MKIIFMFLCFWVLVIPAQARKLTSIEIYKRCSVHLSGLSIPLNDQTVRGIKNGTFDPIKECENLLDLGRLNPSGQLIVDNKKSRAVIRTLMKFHRTWFDVNAIEQIQGYSEEILRGSNDYYDAYEPALTLTRALLAPAVKYRDVVTASYGVKALREDDSRILAKYGYIHKNPTRRVNPGITETTPLSFRNLEDAFNPFSTRRDPTDFLTPTVTQMGELVGIAPRTETAMTKNVYLVPFDTNGSVGMGNKISGLNYQFDMYASHGGGLLGTPVYLLMNFGHPNGVIANGSTKLPRRWIKNSMESLLCSSFPSLRESDIRSLVIGTASAPFRNGTSCVQCHATMDQAATTARNLVVSGTEYVNLVDEASNDSGLKYPVVLPRFTPRLSSYYVWSGEPVENFHLQTPSGELFYRSNTGQLVSRRVASIAELGTAFAEQDDFYTCAAKRYFKYFTGVDVSLYDKTNPANSEINRNITERDKQFRLFVENLGLELKSHQSLTKLIMSIINSNYYKSTDLQNDTIDGDK